MINQKTNNLAKKVLPKFKDTILMLPNLLTYIRILMVPIIVFFLHKENITKDSFWGLISAILFVIAAITDFLDGYYARKLKMKSAVGKILDPLADKLMILSILIMLIPLNRITAYLVVIIMLREFIITALRTLASVAGIIMPADKLGKIKTTFQMIAIPFLLIEYNLSLIDFYTVGLALILISVFFSLISAFFYMNNFFIKAKDLEF